MSRYVRALRWAAVAALTLLGALLVLAVLWWAVQPGRAALYGRETVAPAAAAPGPGRAPVVEDGFRLWERSDDGSPVRWDPCTPIRWTVNPDGAPPDALPDLHRAFDRIAAASGLDFAFAGTTDEEPRRDRAPYQHDRYGDRWAPVLVAWARPHEAGLPLRDVDRAISIPVAVTSASPGVFVTGQVVFATGLELDPGFADRARTWGPTMLHELGHLVGLDHVEDPGQLMYPYAGDGAGQLGAGDRAGLAAVGASGGCVATPAPGPIDVTYVRRRP